MRSWVLAKLARYRDLFTKKCCADAYSQVIDLTGKVALITGSSRGIGRACALEMARNGADIVVNDCSHEEEAKELVVQVQRAGRQAISVGCDVSDRPAVDEMVARVAAEFGRLDIAVCNAYFSKRQPFLELSCEVVQKTVDVTFIGAFHTAQAAARFMANRGEGGALLFISSVLSRIPMPGSLAYNSAKAAMNQMSATIAREMTSHRIRSNCIAPGWTDTPGERQFSTDQEILKLGKKLPWGRLASSEDIARAASFLCSDAADYITGSVLKVDGGFSLESWSAGD